MPPAISPERNLPPLPGPVASAFDAYPPAIRRKAMAIRKLIFETAARTAGVGRLTETLKWGEPAYLTEASRSGTTIRLGWKAARPDELGIFVHCQTTLIANFRRLYAGELQFDGNRAIVLERQARLPGTILRDCIRRALTYHLRD